MAKVVSIKKPSVKKNIEEKEFVLSSEWLLPNTSRTKEKRAYTILKYRIGERKNGRKFFAVYFGQEVSDHVGLVRGTRALIGFHRDDPKRVLLFKSENGFSVAQPDQNSLYFWMNFIINDDFISNKICCHHVDPIYRKGRVVEFRLKD